MEYYSLSFALSYHTGQLLQIYLQSFILSVGTCYIFPRRVIYHAIIVSFFDRQINCLVILMPWIRIVGNLKPMFKDWLRKMMARLKKSLLQLCKLMVTSICVLSASLAESSCG